MNLSNKSSDIKLYSRNKYSDGLPYTSDDIHRDQDLRLRKLGLIMDSLIGSGPLETPNFEIIYAAGGMSARISKPIAVNLNGEIFLVGSSSNSYPITLTNAYTNFTGSLVLICWYTKLTSSSELYEYGGLSNYTLQNDIIDSKLNIQTSARYQVRWNIGYCTNIFDYSNPVVQNINLVGSIKTEYGYVSSLVLNSTKMSVNGKFYTLPATTQVPSADGFIHVLPLAKVSNKTISSFNAPLSLSSIESSSTPNNNKQKVWYNPDTDTVKMYFNGAWRDVGGSSIIKQESEPTNNVKEGTIWYNTKLGEFKIYIEGIGFVDTYAKMGFVQLQATHTFMNSVNSNQNITITIPIDTYLSSDILKVSYEGLELIKDVNYTLNTANKTITLTDFTADSGDKVLFTITRLVGASDLTTTLSMLSNHMNDNGSSSSFGHVKLSDTSDTQFDESSGIAATPKSVKSVEDKINTYIDETTETVYELGVNNGLLFIREKE